LFDKNRIAKLKKGVLIVNNARGAIMDTQAVADACSSGHIAGNSQTLRQQNCISKYNISLCLK
jgi:formate dehydrogenase